MTPYKDLTIGIITALALCQTSCSRKDQYKEGETVTWKFNDELIIKAKVGERREHIKDTHCPKCERASYQPEYEHYLGQFPIDYQPESFKKLTVAEAEALPYSNSLEFNLMLNGSWVEATDKDVVSENALDHEDQVKVVIQFYNRLGRNTDTKTFFLKNTNNLNIKSAVTSEDMVCYSYKDRHGKKCLGISTNPSVSGFSFSINSNKNRRIYVESHENNIYSPMTVTWAMHPKNLEHIQKIDTTIWRLLKAWNVSSVNSN